MGEGKEGDEKELTYTALEWAGLFTCRHSCATSTAVTPEKLFHSASPHQALAGSAPRLSMRGTSALTQQTMKQPFFFVKTVQNKTKNTCQLKMGGGVNRPNFRYYYWAAQLRASYC